LHAGFTLATTICKFCSRDLHRRIRQYGFGKGDSLATSLVWAGVAGAVVIVLALWLRSGAQQVRSRWGV
jgi:hypothetical protein